MADEINRDLSGSDPLFVSVLNGSFMFTADLMKRLTIPCEISFVKLASYEGTSTTGRVKELVGLNDDISGTLRAKNPKDIRIATLLVKPDKLQVDLKIDYVAMNIPNDFIVGYGLDYDGYGRNFRDIYIVED